MIAVITVIELRNPFKFFALSYNALQIIKQIKNTRYKAFKSTGLWTTHYTMSLWENKEDMQDFARSGAHQKAMKLSASMSKEIRTLTIDTDQLPDWETAKRRLNSEGKILRF